MNDLAEFGHSCGDSQNRLGRGKWNITDKIKMHSLYVLFLYTDVKEISTYTSIYLSYLFFIYFKTEREKKYGKQEDSSKSSSTTNWSCPLT